MASFRSCKSGRLPIYVPGRAAGNPRMTAMVDEMDRLRASTGLCELLQHYATLGKADRNVWQDRLGELPGVSPRELVLHHGELLAFGWLEQNTGLTPVLRSGCAPACYRVTAAGARALKNLHAEPAEA